MEMEIKRTRAVRTWNGMQIEFKELTVEEVMEVFGGSQEQEKPQIEEKKEVPKEETPKIQEKEGDVVDVELKVEEENAVEKVEEKEPQKTIIDQLMNLVSICTEDKVTLDMIRKSPPSSIRNLLSHMEQVNRDFFWMLDMVGMDKDLIRAEIGRILTFQFRKLISIVSTR